MPKNKPRKSFLYSSMANEEDDPIIQEVKVCRGSSDCTGGFFFVVIIVPVILTLLERCGHQYQCLSYNLCARKYAVRGKYTAHGICFARTVVSVLADSAQVFPPFVIFLC